MWWQLLEMREQTLAPALPQVLLRGIEIIPRASLKRAFIFSITVMASGSYDTFASFSNYGSCAHIIAPVRFFISMLTAWAKHAFGLHGMYLQGVDVKSVGNAVGSGKSNSLTRTVSYAVLLFVCIRLGTSYSSPMVVSYIHWW